MKTFGTYFNGFRPGTLLILGSFCLMGLQACKIDNKHVNSEPTIIEKENVVEIITNNMDFQMPDTIKSGWNTFLYKNLSTQTHFFLIDKYPDGKTLEDAKTLVVPHFENGMKLINEGKSEEGFAEFGKLPLWFSEVKFLGGSGLISPGLTAQTMINLEPGYYLIECYVKMSDGVFHNAMGMLEELVVLDINSENKVLEATANIDISSTEGIVFIDSIASGNHIFLVNYKDQIVHENFVGHDINLVKLDNNASLEVLEKWMNWADPKGLIEPAPAGFIFLGGVNDMPAGNKGYFTAILEPGNYALISEVPNALSKNMLKTFKVYDQ
jgi:hypothetical protein